MLKLNSTGELYEKYTSTMHRIADLRAAGAVLQWDQETYLPLKGARLRGQQIATITELAHEAFIRKDFGDLLKELMLRDELESFQKRNVEISLSEFSRQEKFSPAFVRKISEAVNTAFHSWISARKENKFSVFASPLETLVKLKIEEAEIAGYDEHPYDALMTEYDRGATVTAVDKVFENIIPKLKDILDSIMASEPPDDSLLRQFFPRTAQWDFGMTLLKDMHFDFDAGRQDISEHPFTTSFHSQDVRITTRIDENDLANMIWSCIHELGHALYEQGLPQDQYGLPLGEYCSLSIHESQSRLWENHVGRSSAFVNYYFPVLQKFFPQQMKDAGTKVFYRAINKVSPSLIRTEADELTYHFHVSIRYQLEKELISGTLATRDISAYWNELYEKYLNVKVPDDKRGCLQDVHWSHGSFGYFPTYSLGSFYAAQIFHAANKAVGPLDSQIETGKTDNLLNWLRENIHRHGKTYESKNLCILATGEELNQEYFLNYVRKKYGNLYSLQFAE